MTTNLQEQYIKGELESGWYWCTSKGEAKVYPDFYDYDTNSWEFNSNKEEDFSIVAKCDYEEHQALIEQTDTFSEMLVQNSKDILKLTQENEILIAENERLKDYIAVLEKGSDLSDEQRSNTLAREDTLKSQLAKYKEALEKCMLSNARVLSAVMDNDVSAIIEEVKGTKEIINQALSNSTSKDNQEKGE